MYLHSNHYHNLANTAHPRLLEIITFSLSYAKPDCVSLSGLMLPPADEQGGARQTPPRESHLCASLSAKNFGTNVEQHYPESVLSG